MKNKTKKILITMKENIKLINVKYIKILIIFLLILYILSYVLIAIYSFTFEKDKIAIDRYNFEQLEKAKPILETIGEKDERFFSLNEFNERYGTDIKPIRNCYYVSNYNGNEKYIFGFKLESLFNIYIYKKNYFAYPKYDMPYLKRLPADYDLNLSMFEETILKPCRD
ncbi:hypothetical protein HUU51_03970 [Candidatus Gracilibacteria bacterium]|nr:hypothetical protein [Candidatus Gracilibacteria bacterium]